MISVELVLMTYDDYPIIKSFYQDKDVMKMITGDVLSEQEMKEKWEIITSWNHDLKSFSRCWMFKTIFSWC